MQVKSIKTRVFRFNPDQDKEPFVQEYNVPWEPGMTAMDALDYIYQNVDGTLAYYDHAACKLGICARCTGRVNGKPGLLCQIEVSDKMVIEPVSNKHIVRDLVCERRTKESEVS
jgi:succinate dehydrogenase/fumarate reductase iron-sulfur protein